MLCLPTIEFVEFLGRKFMLILSAVGMGISLLGLMIMYIVLSPTCLCMGSDWQNTLISALIYVYVCSYSLGWGSVVMLVYTEIVYFDVSIQLYIRNTLYYKSTIDISRIMVFYHLLRFFFYLSVIITHYFRSIYYC